MCDCLEAKLGLWYLPVFNQKTTGVRSYSANVILLLSKLLLMRIAPHTFMTLIYGLFDASCSFNHFISCCNFWLQGDILEDPANEPKEDMYMMSVSPQDAPDLPE